MSRVPVERAGPNLHFGIGSAGSGARFASYILRPEAVRSQREYPRSGEGRMDSPVFVRNLPELLRGGEDPEEIRDVLSSFVETDHEWERLLARSPGTGPEWYYAVATFPSGVWPTPREAQAMADDYLAIDFARARVIGAGHYNTDNYHVNLLILARDIDGRRLQLGQRYFRQDQSWAKVFLRHTEPDEERRKERLRIHLRKKREMRRFKRAIRQELQSAKNRGRPISMDEAVQRVARTLGVPQRYADYRNIEIHPHAQEAAELIRRYLTSERLSRDIKRAPESTEAVEWRRRMLDLGLPGRLRGDLTTLIELHRTDEHFLAQVRRLAGDEAFRAASAAIERALRPAGPTLAR